jgi:hypothetical protein
MLGTAWRARVDRNALVLFNRANGDKLRFVIGRYTKAKRPELVDIKITDYCAFGCPFCYQGSTIQGKHATTENLFKIVAMLKKAKVLEVAIGGGEPTDHPDFPLFLGLLRDNGIVANFTTKSLGYVKRNWPHLDALGVGAFAYSCESAKDVHSAAKSLAGVPRNRVNLHYVMGLEDEAGFVAFMRAAHDEGFRVTLLGYKTVGRGAEVIPNDYSQWIELVNILVYLGQAPTMSIDTPLAAQYADLLPVPGYAFHTKEGYISAYIDAVQMGMSASSFENQDLIPLSGNLVRDYREVVPS